MQEISSTQFDCITVRISPQALQQLQHCCYAYLDLWMKLAPVPCTQGTLLWRRQKERNKIIHIYHDYHKSHTPYKFSAKLNQTRPIPITIDLQINIANRNIKVDKHQGMDEQEGLNIHLHVYAYTLSICKDIARCRLMYWWRHIITRSINFQDQEFPRCDNEPLQWKLISLL